MKYIITWNTGYGDESELVEAKSDDAANTMAYDAWREDAEAQADFSAQPWTEELEEELL